MPGLSSAPDRRPHRQARGTAGWLALFAAVAVVSVVPGAPGGDTTDSARPAAGSEPPLRETGGAPPEPTAPEPGQPRPSEDTVAVSPFTGAPGTLGPVLAVPVAAAGPHHGLGEADLVYVAEAADGQSRLTAIYASSLPTEVGPVDTADAADLALLPTFGEPALASAADTPDLAGADVHPLTPDETDGAFRRDGDRDAPHDLLLDPALALPAAPGASLPRDVGFRFGPAPSGGTELASRTVTYPAASVTFDWSRDRAEWLVAVDDEPARDAAGRHLGAPTVVVQRTGSGPATTDAPSVGSGHAEVLRDGRSFPARWERTDPEHGTSFTDADGWLVPFATGPVWIVYEEAAD